MFVHETVLKEEAVESLRIQPEGVYVDCTVGGAGHSQMIANKLSPSGTLIGLDQDQEAINIARERLQSAKCRVILIKTNFRQIKQVVGHLGLSKVDGILFDLGVSSPQFDHQNRGFSYQKDAPLDMRMDQTQSFSAYQLVNEWSEKEIADILFRYGEERFSRRIARQIVLARKKQPIRTTFQLVELIKQAIPASARRTGSHPARRSFQAIRIAVNDELNVLQQTLQDALDLLKKHGRMCVITFHSLEDRICKQFFLEHATSCICPPEIPVCVCNHQPLLRLITKKPIVPTKEEIKRNRRARSAKLRVIEKC